MKKTGYSLLIIVLAVSAIILYTNSSKPSEVVSKLDYDEPKKADRPELYLSLLDELTTKSGQSGPDYPLGYRFAELQKARRNLQVLRTEETYEFIERGPANVPGRTRGLIVDPDDPTHKTWFAGGVGGGIWKTTDGGQSWQDQSPDIPNLSISWLVMAESNHDILYAGTGEGWGGSSNFIKGNGILKSTDHGTTWAPLASTTENPAFEIINRIIVDPQNPDIVLAATSTDRRYNRNPASGIYKSMDGGITWDLKYSSETYVQQIVADPIDFNIQYAAESRRGVLKSTDAGETWQDSSVGLVVSRRIELAVSPVNTNRLYASAQGDLSGSGADLYFSDDAGATWNLAVEENGKIIDFLGGQGWYDNTILAHPFNLDEVYVGGVDLWKFKISDLDVNLGKKFAGADRENLESFFTLQGFNSGTLDDGTIAVGELDPQEFVSVEIRFGPDGEGGFLKQMAHRFTVPDGRTSGVDDEDYTFADYVEVPFQVWDIENNRQLMVAFRDQQKNGIFNLLPENLDSEDWQNNSREYIYISNITYDASAPESNMTTNGGHKYNNLFFLWPLLPENGNWKPAEFPEAVYRIRYNEVVGRSSEFFAIADSYNRYEGNNSFSQITGQTTISGVHPDHHNIVPVIHDLENKQFQLIIANDGGIYSSDVLTNPGFSEGTWDFAGNGYNTAQFYAVDKAPGQSRYVGGLQDNGSWMVGAGQEASNSTRYRRVNGGDGFGTAWNYARNNEILTTLYFNRIEKSTNQGGQSTASVSGLTDVGSSLGPFVTELEYYHADPDVVYTVGRSGVWKSEDFADTWTLAPIEEKWPTPIPSTIFARISLANPNIVWAGTGMDSDRAFHVSTDAGNSFSVTNNFPGEWRRASGFATHPTLDSTAFALFSYSRSPKILRTDDLGQTWRDITGFALGESDNGFPDVSVRDLLVMPNDTSVFWAATEIGIFESTDGGGSWHLLPGNLPAIPVWDIKIVDKEVVLGSHGRGIWSIELEDLSGHVYIPEIVSAFPTRQGNPVFQLRTRSAYDSAILFVNGQRAHNIAAINADTVIDFPANMVTLPAGNAYVRAFRDGRPFVSKVFNYELFAYANVLESYANNFENGGEADFAGSGFAIKLDEDLGRKAIHSDHFYQETAQYFYVLKNPIKVKQANALINYFEVALVEPGAPEAIPGSPEFKDYVVVQGSLDGQSWLNLLDPYDASSQDIWQKSYGPLSRPTPPMVTFRSLNLLDSFAPGDEILIRFILYSDKETTGWGWMIDNLNIQTESVITSLDNEINSTQFAVYPNPVTGSSINLVPSDNIQEIQVSLINSDGKIALEKVLKLNGNSELELPADLRNGFYVLQINSQYGRETHKLMIDR